MFIKHVAANLTSMVFGQLWGGEGKNWLFYNVINSTLYEIEGQHLAAAACHIQTHESGRARHKNSFDIKQTKINITKHVLAARCDGQRKYLEIFGLQETSAILRSLQRPPGWPQNSRYH